MNMTIKINENNEMKTYVLVENIIKDEVLYQQLREFFFSERKNIIFFNSESKEITNDIILKVQSIPKTLIECQYDFFPESKNHITFDSQIKYLMEPLINIDYKKILEKNISSYEQELNFVKKELQENIEFIKENTNKSLTPNLELENLKTQIENFVSSKENFQEKQILEKKYWNFKEIVEKYNHCNKNLYILENKIKKITFEKELNEIMLSSIIPEYKNNVNKILSIINKLFNFCLLETIDKSFKIYFKNNNFDYEFVHNNVLKDVNLYFYEKNFFNIFLNFTFLFLYKIPFCFITNKYYELTENDQKKISLLIKEQLKNTNFVF